MNARRAGGGLAHAPACTAAPSPHVGDVCYCTKITFSGLLRGKWLLAASGQRCADHQEMNKAPRFIILNPKPLNPLTGDRFSIGIFVSVTNIPKPIVMYFKARNAARPRYFVNSHWVNRSPRSKLPNSYDISDLLGILRSRREWPEARISVGIPVRVLIRTRLRSATAFRTEPNRSGLKI